MSKTIDVEIENGSFNTEHKLFIREYWNKPLLKFLVKKIDSKLVYMGLPSPNGEDITHWIDFIKVVIAFQCREYGTHSQVNQSRDSIDKLEEFLRALERENKLENFWVYDGYLEEVVIRGYDNSPQKIEFNQESIITLYNLDFCNDIASPIEYTDKNGDVKKVYKFNAIQKLLEIQNNLSNLSDKFLFFLTVHCSYNGVELQNFVNNPPNALIGEYLKKYFQLKAEDKNSRIVRLFICHQIQSYFISYNFSYKILPIIIYNGIKGTSLLHFVVLGTKPTVTASGVSNYQSFNEIIDKPFITIDSDKFISTEQLYEEEIIDNLNSVEFFTQSKTYQHLWQ